MEDFFAELLEKLVFELSGTHLKLLLKIGDLLSQLLQSCGIGGNTTANGGVVLLHLAALVGLFLVDVDAKHVLVNFSRGRVCFIFLFDSQNVLYLAHDVIVF